MFQESQALLFSINVRKVDPQTYRAQYASFQEEHIPYDNIQAITTAQGISSIKTALIYTNDCVYQAQETFPNVFKSMQQQIGEKNIVDDEEGKARACITGHRSGFVMFGEKSKCILNIYATNEINQATQTVILKNGKEIRIDGANEWTLFNKFFEKFQYKTAKWERDKEHPNSFPTFVEYTRLTTDVSLLAKQQKAIQRQLQDIQNTSHALVGCMIGVVILLIVILLLVIFLS